MAGRRGEVEFWQEFGPLARFTSFDIDLNIILDSRPPIIA